VFAIAAVDPAYSSTNRLAVGGYDLVDTNVTVTGNNFLSMLTVGALTVNPKEIAAADLGILGVTKTYDGSAAISGALLNVDAANSQVLSGDVVNVYATGNYADADVGSNKSIVVDVSLSTPVNLINDARNYSLSTTRVTGNLGTINQLSQVSWIGSGANANWSNASNWLGGATPTFSIAANMPNVANVIIPVGATVVYDSASLGNSGSAISNNGTITFNGANNFTFADNVSGTGALSVSGAGTLTLTGNNTYSGITNINASSLIVGSVNALGTSNSISANGGSLALATGVDLLQLTVNGGVTISSDIRTVGAQVYNGAVTLAGGTDTVDALLTSQTLKLISLTTNNANITFNGTLTAGDTSLADKRSILLDAGTGRVTFNERVGAVTTSFGAFLARSADESPYQLEVRASNISINADITTFERQIYRGDVLIGDNGTNAMTRILLSEDPSIRFLGKVDDVVANTHGLKAMAVSIYGNEVPEIAFEDDVGSIAALASLEVVLGQQNQDLASPFSDITVSDPTQYLGNLTLAASVTTSGNQSYTANTIKVGDQTVTSSGTANTIKLTSTEGGVTFRTGSTGGIQGVGLNPKLEVLRGATGSVAGLGVATGLQTSIGIFNVSPIESSGGLRPNAGFFANLINRSIEQSLSSLEGNEVVEVGEVGLLEGGKVKRLNGADPICNNPDQDECRPK
jgi:autotransporter-associated beta strand protein